LEKIEELYKELLKSKDEVINSKMHEIEALKSINNTLEKFLKLNKE
jgi:hypothetical protein